ncbi:MAG: nucleoside hydrolase [Planctomycetota bacterium]|jgi:inosine-uridine nucleoside N-ribohydrolase
MPRKIILDTDIGDDIDDAYALALILGSPELELAGVTTVFGNTPARTRQAQTILKLVGREDVPVATGCGNVMSPRVTHRGPDLGGGQSSLALKAREYLEDVRPGQDATALPAGELPAPDPRHAVDFLIETIMAGGGDIVPVTIGAMTNLGMALVKEPRVAAKVPRVLSMAGWFTSQQAEWNIKCDPVAAAVVFGSGVPVTSVGIDVTRQVRFTQDELDRLYSCERPPARNLAAATKAWGHGFPTLHDPLAVETLIRDDIVTMKRGRVTVELAGTDTYGVTVFREGDGPHEVGAEVEADEAKALWFERVLAL